ncbi:hypothetical protein JKP88DRAFT_199505 [Tribonema minus]|uniref:HECT-type E3 ubiquitin transferase n=1 Tax=Tribonema minus TaxID=303371 RepID=A0A835YYA3_9STRA|nr:hypothetical protein JKP88DRAFT_199505 [Tribonema minus]
MPGSHWACAGDASFWQPAHAPPHPTPLPPSPPTQNETPPSQVVPFQQRVAIFRRLVDAERSHAAPMAAWGGRPGDTQRIRVRRTHLFDDSFEALGGLGAGLRRRLQVTFVNEHGMEEAGIDGGGVLKEFIDALTKCTFDPALGLFQATDEQLLYPSPDVDTADADTLARFEFAGSILGKAVFEGILVEPQLSPTFLNTLLGRDNIIDDLFTLDPALYRSLVQLKALAATPGQDVADLALTFSNFNTGGGGGGGSAQQRVVDLVPGGRALDVTNANVASYVLLLAHYRLDRATARQTRAFLRGFRALVPTQWVRLFAPRELQRLVGGDGERRIDIADLRAHTTYGGGYHESQPVMHWFWDIIANFTPAQQALFLKFVTSCSRQPLLGFKHLSPPMCIQQVESGERGNKLPSSATCMNLLKLPRYDSRETLREKLLYAISAGAGFELT